MFLALFHIKAGKYTIEEFDVATEEFKRTGKTPKSYVYCRDLQDGEQESEELKEFKHRLFEEMGHYYCRYNNKDSMQLHFVMQLQLVENSRMDDLKVQDGTVCLGDTPIARMDNLRFAADNEDYQRMSRRLAELPQKIEKKRLHVEKYPDDTDSQEELQDLLNERNQLQEAFDQQQQFLFDTAKRIAQLQGDTITDRMRRAIDAFEQGNVREANILLKEAERDADRNLSDYKQSKEITEQKRQNVIHSIDELLLKTSTVMADASIAIEQRITEVKSLYAKADELAQEVDYDKDKYAKLLFDYAQFLYKYAFYKEAVAIYLRQIALSEELYGTEHSDTATSYNNIGLVYCAQGDYPKALESYFKALAIKEKVLGKEHPSTAYSYNNIGATLFYQGKYQESLDYFTRAFNIFEVALGPNHPNTITVKTWMDSVK
jgi:tetratricopeptide (TPR) repeat protein